MIRLYVTQIAPRRFLNLFFLCSVSRRTLLVPNHGGKLALTHNIYAVTDMHMAVALEIFQCIKIYLEHLGLDVCLLKNRRAGCVLTCQAVSLVSEASKRGGESDSLWPVVAHMAFKGRLFKLTACTTY